MAKTEIDGDQIKDASVDLGVDTTGTLALGRGGTGQTTAKDAFNGLSPLLSKGDTLTNDGTDDQRLAVGANGTVLTADSAQGLGVKWATPAAGGALPTSDTIITSDLTVGPDKAAYVPSVIEVATGAILEAGAGSIVESG